MAAVVTQHPDTLERMVRAVERVRGRLLRSTTAPESAGLPNAVVGGNAVAAWVSQVDEGAVRNTRDADVFVHLQDLAHIGLIDDTWPARFPDVLADRLRAILADPEG